jgi:hypothetical protein
VRLKAVAAENSKFVGWAPTRTCPKPSFTVQAGEPILCQPVSEVTEPTGFLQAAGYPAASLTHLLTNRPEYRPDVGVRPARACRSEGTEAVSVLNLGC